MNTRAFDDLVYIHADESCLGNQFSDRPTPGGAAGLLEFFDGSRGWTRRDYYVSEPDTTNNRMALRSAIEGLSPLRRPCRVILYSDSSYLSRGMKEWIHVWARRGWRRKGGRIENLELWVALMDAARRHRIEWRWVRGHAGDPKNEYANHLAVKAAKTLDNSTGLVPSGFQQWLEAQQEQDRYLDFFDLPPEAPFRPDPTPPPSP